MSSRRGGRADALARDRVAREVIHGRKAAYAAR
jgi:hypothetical protein